MSRCAQCTCAALRRHYMTTQRERYIDALEGCLAEYKIGVRVEEFMRLVENAPTPCLSRPRAAPASAAAAACRRLDRAVGR